MQRGKIGAGTRTDPRPRFFNIVFGVPDGFIETGLGPRLVNQPAHQPALQVVHAQGHPRLYRHRIPYQRERPERVGVIRLKVEHLWDKVKGPHHGVPVERLPHVVEIHRLQSVFVDNAVVDVNNPPGRILWAPWIRPCACSCHDLPVHLFPRRVAKGHQTLVQAQAQRAICAASSKLFPALQPAEPCSCPECRSANPAGAGLFVVPKRALSKYLAEFQPVQLRYNAATKGVDPEFSVLNFGEAKGLGFDRVLIYPTQDMVNWLENNTHELKDQTRAKFYVALTRARHSVGIVSDSKEDGLIEGFSVYK